jgi:major membrane immunogen (membrane-anchored lipoprotein)
MRTFKTIGAVGIAAALLLSAVPAFAKTGTSDSGQPQTGDDSRVGAATTSARGGDGARLEMEVEHGKVVQRLGDIKDQAKQQLALQLTDQFGNLNQTWTNHFSNVLDQLTAALGKIQDRSNIAAGKGKDVSSTTAAILAAQTAITAARAAVAAQAAKTYAPTSSTIPATATSTASGQERIMQALRKSFQALHTGLFKDLMTLRDGPMKDARKAVQNAFQSLGKIPGVDDDSATTSPSH